MSLERFLKNESVLKVCKIYQMLLKASKDKHVSFHTPGHKIGQWDITELSFSDNLSAPKGCILEAERDIAAIFKAEKSFILTDGSTSGVLSMLYAAKLSGAKKIAFCEASHQSVYNGCAALGLVPLLFSLKKKKGIPLPFTKETLVQQADIFKEADAVLLTSPDYYGNVADLKSVRSYCDEMGKLLLVDGAHGGHLHFAYEQYAGSYADVWVDGVHKSLPAFTQGAVVSAKKMLSEKLRQAVNVFRTTSPSYPIMASVEYAVKFPRNIQLETAVNKWKANHLERVYANEDWTKLCAVFEKNAFKAKKALEKEGIYAEFCDGNVLAFYLSPALEQQDFELLTKRLEGLFSEYPILENDEDRCALKEIEKENPPTVYEMKETEWLELKKAEDRICAACCGLFPPCAPLLNVGEKVTKEKITLLENASNVFGVSENKILVFQEKTKE